MDLSSYKTLIFDCDGVILNSNKVKTQAFYNAALSYGEQAAQALVDYHVNNGGISRYKKFELFLMEIVPTGINGPGLEKLLSLYAQEVRDGLLRCELAEGLEELRRRTAHSKWLIVSGGDQNELQEIFRVRGIDRFFDGGIFGSPEPKERILAREINDKNIIKPAIFFGDSRYDHQAAVKFGLDFVFVSDWSEFSGWKEYCLQNQIYSINKICQNL